VNFADYALASRKLRAPRRTLTTYPSHWSKLQGARMSRPLQQVPFASEKNRTDRAWFGPFLCFISPIIKCWFLLLCIMRFTD